MGHLQLPNPGNEWQAQGRGSALGADIIKYRILKQGVLVIIILPCSVVVGIFHALQNVTEVLIKYTMASHHIGEPENYFSMGSFQPRAEVIHKKTGLLYSFLVIRERLLLDMECSLPYIPFSR